MRERCLSRAEQKDEREGMHAAFNMLTMQSITCIRDP